MHNFTQMYKPQTPKLHAQKSTRKPKTQNPKFAPSPKSIDPKTQNFHLQALIET